jgi:outer membrane protein assembly factor BamB
MIDRPQGSVSSAVEAPERPQRALRMRQCAAVLLLAAACTNHDPVGPDGAADRIIWSAPMVGFARGVPAASTDAVFAPSDSGLAAFDRATGELRWLSRVPGMAGNKRVLVRGGRVLAAASAAVRAHDAATGAVLWERSYDHDREYPAGADLAADESTLYVGLFDGRELALAQSDGHVLWEARVGTAEWIFKGGLAGSTISGDTLFVTATRYLNANAFQQTVVVVALERSTGRELWRYQYAGTDMDVDHAAVVSGGNLIFTDGLRGYVVALDPATGTQRWQQLMKGFFFGGPEARGDTIFVATSESRAYAIDAVTGRTLWTAQLENGATSVGLCNNEVFASDFHVEVRSAGDGSRVGLAFTGNQDEITTSRVAVADGIAYVGTNKRLMAFTCH